MRIAFVCQPFDQVLPPDQNSIGLWSYHVGRRLASEHQVTVYLKRLWAGVSASAEPFECRFVRIVPQRAMPHIDRVTNLFSRPGRPSFAALHRYIEYSLQVALDLRRRRPDVVHIHNFSQFVPVIRAFNPQARIVLHMQGEWLSQLDYSMIERRLQQVDRVVGCSNHIIDLVRRRFPHLAERCVTINNGFDTSIFDDSAAPAPREPGKRVLFVGRVSAEKGLHHLLEAFQLMAAQVPDATLDIVGPEGDLPREYIVALSDDPHVAALDQFYDGRGYPAHLRDRIPAALAERVRFRGGMPQAAIAAFYQSADLLVNPSLSESFGMSIVEAGSFGVPAIVTRAGGMKETVAHGRSGLVVETGDVPALAEAICALLNDDERRLEMGRAARSLIRERYSWDRIAADALALYQQAVKQNGRTLLHAQPDPPNL